MGKYRFELSEEDKILTIYLDGFFEADAANSFKEEYLKMVNLLNDSKQYDLRLECEGMTVIKANLLEDLGQCIKQYTEDFKNVVVIKNVEQKVLTIQTNKLIEKLNLFDKITIKEV